MQLDMEHMMPYHDLMSISRETIAALAALTLLQQSPNGAKNSLDCR